MMLQRIAPSRQGMGFCARRAGLYPSSKGASTVWANRDGRRRLTAKAGSANIWARMRQPMRAPGARYFYAQASPVRGPRGKKAKARLLKKGFARRLPHKSTIRPEA